MKIFENVLLTIGHTPLIKLNRIASALPVTILVKVESLNPGGSVKDRVGLSMIAAAEREGLLRPGSTIIEATAGNTGVGLALCAAVKGYRCIFVLPDKMSADKINLLKAYGAEVVITPTSVAPDSPESYNGVADRLSREIPGSFRPNQFANEHNPAAHYHTTGPEIWEDTEGNIDVFVAGMGTGGTISGVGLYLKEQNPWITIVGADPEGSILSGDAPHSSQVEGIGEDFIPRTFDRQVIDEFVRVSDQEAFTVARRLAREEGLLVGGSAGAALAAAIKYSHRLPAGKTVVVLLPDTGRNYLTKFFSDSWMVENGFAHPDPNPLTALDALREKQGVPALLSIGPDERVSVAIDLMSTHGISQVPVIADARAVGSLTEVTMVRLLKDHLDPEAVTAEGVMGLPLPQLDERTDLGEIYRLLLAGHGGVVLTRAGQPSGFVTRSDLMKVLAKQNGQRGGRP